jgi:tungstate transport system substrate-binding protein
VTEADDVDRISGESVERPLRRVAAASFVAVHQTDAKPVERNPSWNRRRRWVPKPPSPRGVVAGVKNQADMKHLTLLAGLLLAAASPAAGTSVILATTTSTQDTGLLDVLVPAFERSTGYRVKTIAVGTGAALAMGEKGDADVLLVHAPKAEEAYMAEGRGLERAAVMHDSFIVVGPGADPANVKGAPTAVAAFKRIAMAGAPFVSRADDSGTNKKELELWQAAGVTPGGWYVRTGSGMADTLHVASQKAAYALTDDGTYLAQRSTLELVPVVEDAKDLRNAYHVIVVKPIPGRVGNLDGAEAFAKYVVSPEGQKLIGSFGTQRFGRPLFVPDAETPTVAR